MVYNAKVVQGDPYVLFPYFEFHNLPVHLLLFLLFFHHLNLSSHTDQIIKYQNVPLILLGLFKQICYYT